MTAMPQLRNIDPDDEAQLLATIDRWVEKEVAPIVKEYDHADRYPAETVEQMKELGLFGATISPDYGGLGLPARTYAKINESADTKRKATDFYVSIQIVGTPQDCLDKIGELQHLTGLDHLVTEYSFGAMPHEEAEINMRLFADRVMPVLQRDAAFAGPAAPGAGAAAPAGPRAEGLFAPA